MVEEVKEEASSKAVKAEGRRPVAVRSPTAKASRKPQQEVIDLESGRTAKEALIEWVQKQPEEVIAPLLVSFRLAFAV